MSVIELFSLIRSDLLRLSLQKDGTHPKNPKLINIINPRFFPVFMIRLSRFFYLIKFLRPLSWVLSWLNFILFSIEFTPRCKVGPGLMIPHTSGVVVGAFEIGANVTIFQGVTLGSLNADLFFNELLRPIIESEVTVGSGAKVLGGITIGQGSKVGANAVVLDSVQPYQLVVGVPARVVKSSGNGGY